MMIVKIKSDEYPRLLEIWESAVRNTHDFLLEEDFLYYKENMLIYFEHVQLWGLKDKQSTLLGFVGLSDDMIEMLFIHQDARGKGIGKQLLQYAIANYKIDKVDVNEQNEQAVGFYKHMGFVIESRDARDGQGKEYPILHMVLPKMV